jgi:hypothetical protein
MVDNYKGVVAINLINHHGTGKVQSQVKCSCFALLYLPMTNTSPGTWRPVGMNHAGTVTAASMLGSSTALPAHAISPMHHTFLVREHHTSA